MESVAGSFHLALGVNTFRYPIRHGTVASAVQQLESLLQPGGRVVVIDMNDRFPYQLKPRRNTDAQRTRWRFGTAPLPTLDGYAAPLENGGFEVVRKEHFLVNPALPPRGSGSERRAPPRRSSTRSSPTGPCARWSLRGDSDPFGQERLRLIDGKPGENASNRSRTQFAGGNDDQG